VDEVAEARDRNFWRQNTAARKAVEKSLLESLCARGVSGAKELRDSRLPKVEMTEAVRDEDGRLLGTVKRILVDESALADARSACAPCSVPRSASE
jgi:hypothetical protein